MNDFVSALSHVEQVDVLKSCARFLDLSLLEFDFPVHQTTLEIENMLKLSCFHSVSHENEMHWDHVVFHNCEDAIDSSE